MSRSYSEATFESVMYQMAQIFSELVVSWNTRRQCHQNLANSTPNGLAMIQGGTRNETYTVPRGDLTNQPFGESRGMTMPPDLTYTVPPDQSPRINQNFSVPPNNMIQMNTIPQNQSMSPNQSYRGPTDRSNAPNATYTFSNSNPSGFNGSLNSTGTRPVSSTEYTSNGSSSSYGLDSTGSTRPNSSWNPSPNSPTDGSRSSGKDPKTLYDTRRLLNGSSMPSQTQSSSCGQTSSNIPTSSYDSSIPTSANGSSIPTSSNGSSIPTNANGSSIPTNSNDPRSPIASSAQSRVSPTTSGPTESSPGGVSTSRREPTASSCSPASAQGIYESQMNPSLSRQDNIISRQTDLTGPSASLNSRAAFPSPKQTRIPVTSGLPMNQSLGGMRNAYSEPAALCPERTQTPNEPQMYQLPLTAYHNNSSLPADNYSVPTNVTQPPSPSKPLALEADSNAFPISGFTIGYSPEPDSVLGNGVRRGSYLSDESETIGQTFGYYSLPQLSRQTNSNYRPISSSAPTGINSYTNPADSSKGNTNSQIKNTSETTSSSRNPATSSYYPNPSSAGTSEQSQSFPSTNPTKSKPGSDGTSIWLYQESPNNTSISSGYPNSSFGATPGLSESSPCSNPTSTPSNDSGWRNECWLTCPNCHTAVKIKVCGDNSNFFCGGKRLGNQQQGQSEQLQSGQPESNSEQRCLEALLKSPQKLQNPIVNVCQVSYNRNLIPRPEATSHGDIPGKECCTKIGKDVASKLKPDINVSRLITTGKCNSIVKVPVVHDEILNCQKDALMEIDSNTNPSFWKIFNLIRGQN